MTISVGDKLPAVDLTKVTADGPAGISSDELFGGKTVVLFGVPGAFTPTCSEKHVPSFLGKAEALKAKGVDTIACVAVNDPFVMDAWGKDRNVGDKIVMLADGSATWTKAAGLELDLNELGLGIRSQRFALVAKDGEVTYLAIEQNPGELDAASADKLLATL